MMRINALRIQRLNRGFGTFVDNTLTADNWNSKISGSLKRVSSILGSNIDALKKKNSSSDIWKKAFEAVEKISGSEKRHLFRPQLVLAGYAGARNNEQLLTNMDEKVATFAAGVEMQHVFMLVHDDIIDEATFRRGEETLSIALSKATDFKIDRKDVQSLSMVVGDLLFTRSNKMLCSGANGNSKPIDLILDGAERAGSAQFDEVVGWDDCYNIDDTYSILEKQCLHKSSYTGFVAPLLAGMHLAENSDKLAPGVFEHCANWAKHTGAVFYGLQSISNLIQEPSQTGKCPLHEIQVGRLSLPLLLLQQHFKDSQSHSNGKKFEQVMRKHKSIDDRVILYDLIEEFDLIDECFKLVQEQSEKAQELTDGLKTLEGTQVLRTGLRAYDLGLQKYKAQLETDFRVFKEDENSRKQELFTYHA